LRSPHHRLDLSGSPHNLRRAAAVGSRKGNFSAPNMNESGH
jgi:hypothetical protein